MPDPTYSSYLKIHQLLDLQEPLSTPPEHDEMLFIVIHQAYELWFKLVLHEIHRLSGLLTAGELFGAMATCKRIRAVLKTLVGQMDILETMTPLEFKSFRDRLGTASGFQSSQFREFEFALGHKRPEMLSHYPEGSPDRARLEERLVGRSVVDHLYDFLEHHGVTIPERLRSKVPAEPNAADPDIQEALCGLYRERPDIAGLLELLTDIDEGLQEWRYRHVKMVERTIGSQPGTGGSSGVDFLKATLFQPVFPDLWAIRHRF